MPEVRRVLVFLCVAALLAAAWNPASIDILCAILILSEIGIRFVSYWSGRRRESNSDPQPISLSGAVPARAPPAC